MITNVICPRCATEVDAKAVRCTRCGANLDGTVEPVIMATVAHARPLTDRPWFILIVLLHVGLLGIPYYWKTGYSLRARWLMCFASVAYTIFAVAVIIWGIMQILKLFNA
jgi:hypothetical protein